MTGKRLIILACCLLGWGCEAASPLADRVKVANPFGSLFQNEQEVRQSLPVGMLISEAQAVLRSHGYDLWSVQRQTYRQAYTYHVNDLVRLRSSAEDCWIILYGERDAVVGVEFHPGPGDPPHPSGLQ
ncbi:MAG: hypothetical protein JO112_07755 [Planctomycetes bacterium]|nr:hypothetical protein [Planctomycetota bacterium]